MVICCKMEENEKVENTSVELYIGPLRGSYGISEAERKLSRQCCSWDAMRVGHVVPHCLRYRNDMVICCKMEETKG